ncbi:unnamed protein product [Pseudo-nitzschia multistriata]|uniref:Uncharacterized protein n=1 Tax=Pseudo-nitzschia multistriata TaxID=183589 RepID=A0A448YV67_9STRA|nr:unnamed protein product [Pseudo-nitzschia multistriata]
MGVIFLFVQTVDFRLTHRFCESIVLFFCFVKTDKQEFNVVAFLRNIPINHGQFRHEKSSGQMMTFSSKNDGNFFALEIALVSVGPGDLERVETAPAY